MASQSPSKSVKSVLMPQSTNDIEPMKLDEFDLFSPLKNESPIVTHPASSLSPILQVITPKSNTRSRHPSAATSTSASVMTSIVPSTTVSHDSSTRIIRCIANKRTTRTEFV
jgi:hypothetical protein